MTVSDCCKKEKIMKKIRIIAAVTATLTMLFSTCAFAAPSPMAGTVTIVVPGSGKAQAAEVKTPSQQDVKKLADFIASNVSSIGMGANVKSTIDIVAPEGFKGGDVPVILAAAGLVNGATNVFAYVLGPNGKVTIVPCTVHNGYVGFFTPVFGTVAIVEINPAALGQPKAAGATLH